jgi:hypothetical protein
MSTIRAVTQTARRVGQESVVAWRDVSFGLAMFACGFVVGWVW